MTYSLKERILVFTWGRIGVYRKQGLDGGSHLGKRNAGYRLRRRQRPWKVAWLVGCCGDTWGYWFLAVESN